MQNHDSGTAIQAEPQEKTEFRVQGRAKMGSARYSTKKESPFQVLGWGLEYTQGGRDYNSSGNGCYRTEIGIKTLKAEQCLGTLGSSQSRETLNPH